MASDRPHFVKVTFDDKVNLALAALAKREGSTRTTIARRAVLREIGFLEPIAKAPA